MSTYTVETWNEEDGTVFHIIDEETFKAVAHLSEEEYLKSEYCKADDKLRAKISAADQREREIWTEL